MNLRFLQALVAVAERGSFTGAAETLSLSHSAVSLQIKSLEEDLGTKLVDRAHRPSRLTPEGLAVVERARAVLRGVADIREVVAGPALIGSLRVGVVPSALTGLMPPALARLRQAHPRLQLSLRSDLSADLAQQVRADDLDVAILTGADGALDGLERHVIGHEPLFVLAPPDTTETTVPALLSAHPFIWFSRRTWAGQQIEQALIRHRLDVRGAVEVDSLEAIAMLVQSGIGVSIAPQRLGTPPFGPDLRALPFGRPQERRALVMLTRARTTRRRLIEALLGELRKFPEPARASD